MSKKEKKLSWTEIKRRQERRRRIINIFIHFGLFAGAVIFFIPLVWTISTSLKEPGAIFTYPPQWIPKPIVWENYVKAWISVPFGRWYLNSLLVGATVTFGQVMTSSLAAYAFARLNWPGRDKVFLAYLGTMMIPGAVTMIPVFILLKKLGWIDTYKALILPVMFSTYGTFLLRQFYMTIPVDLSDAALIDGCSHFGIWWRIIMPLAKPALATLTIFTFLGNWNSFMWPLIVTNSMEMKTLPVGLASFQGLYTTDWNLLMAASIIVLIPVIVVYLFNQRFFVKGIALTGIKG